MLLISIQPARCTLLVRKRWFKRCGGELIRTLIVSTTDCCLHPRWETNQFLWWNKNIIQQAEQSGIHSFIIWRQRRSPIGSTWSPCHVRDVLLRNHHERCSGTKPTHPMILSWLVNIVSSNKILRRRISKNIVKNPCWTSERPDLNPLNYDLCGPKCMPNTPFNHMFRTTYQ